ncbi:hypothetical protein [Rhodopseudomonas sp. RCAM05734]|uniref:hypothetical protein n=1 Tax=Rhodopseudomonas sp. RCAM05734 TaxID=3457549 RepID=UPI0040443144
MTDESLTILGTTLIVALLSSSAFSLSRAIMAERAKVRLRQMIAQRMPRDLALRQLSATVADRDLDSSEIDKALQQVGDNLAQLSVTDRALLQPGLNSNTKAGSNRFVKEMLVASN